MSEAALKLLKCIVRHLVPKSGFRSKMKKKTHMLTCELSVNGELFMAVSEAPESCDIRKKTVWQTMAFNAYDMGSEEAVRNAYEVLSDGGTVIDPLGPCDWNPCCANLIDKYGVFWWIAI